MINFLNRKKEQLYTPIAKAGVRAATSFSPAIGAAVNTSSLFTSPARKPQQNQSLAPQMSVNRPQMSVGRPTIQGSGYSSRYASNPTNYKPRTTTPPPTDTPPPLPTQTQANPMAQYNARIDDFFNRMKDQSASRISQEEANRQKEQQFLEQRYGLMNDSIRGSIPTLQNNFNTFKANTEAGVQDVLTQAENQKEQTRDYFGEANRTAAQARGETQAQARQKFAGQGAVDSRGAGSYQLANENIDSDFNRYVQKNAKEMAYKLTDIDSAVGQYQRQASTLIQTEEAKLQESLREIEYTLADNELQKNQAMQAVYQQYQDRVNGIQDTLSQIEQQAITQKNTIQMELDKLAQTSFTPEFMATGVPTNQAEYEFMVTNADKYKELGIFGGGGGTAQKTIDSEFGKQYAEYISGGGASDVSKQLAQLRHAASLLDGQEGSFGSMAGRMPARDAFYPKAYEAEQLIKEVVQRNLRAILGAQFTEKEGELLMARAFDPKVGLEQNQKRLGSLINQIEQAARAKEAAIRYFEQNGTLQGFQGKLFTSVSDFNVGDGGGQGNNDPLGIL